MTITPPVAIGPPGVFFAFKRTQFLDACRDYAGLSVEILAVFGPIAHRAMFPACSRMFPLFPYENIGIGAWVEIASRIDLVPIDYYFFMDINVF